MHNQCATRTDLETADHLQRREIADGEDDRREQNQPWHQTGEDGARGEQEKERPDQTAKQAQDDKPRHTDLGDAQDVASIRPDAGERSREKGHDAGCVRIDRVEPGEQECWKRHQASATGERVEGAAKERGRSQNDGCNHAVPINAASWSGEIDLAIAVPARVALLGSGRHALRSDLSKKIPGDARRTQDVFS